MLNSEVIGQNPNLTSYSSRAFRFAKRYRGTRGDHPPVWDTFYPYFRPSLAPAAADAPLCASYPGQLRGFPQPPVGADDLTDAPNFGTKFGRRRPCPRYGGLNPRPS